jgi:hypothetical protein
VGCPPRSRHDSCRESGPGEGHRPDPGEARRKLDQLGDKHQAGVGLTQRHQTISELVELWLQRGLPTTTSPGTRANYTTVLGTHVQPAWVWPVPMT